LCVQIRSQLFELLCYYVYQGSFLAQHHNYNRFYDRKEDILEDIISTNFYFFVIRLSMINKATTMEKKAYYSRTCALVFRIKRRLGNKHISPKPTIKCHLNYLKLCYRHSSLIILSKYLNTEIFEFLFFYCFIFRKNHEII
jgi:hypothetical protein